MAQLAAKKSSMLWCIPFDVVRIVLTLSCTSIHFSLNRLVWRKANKGYILCLQYNVQCILQLSQHKGKLIPCALISLDVVFYALLDVYFYQNKIMQLDKRNRNLNWRYERTLVASTYPDEAGIRSNVVPLLKSWQSKKNYRETDRGWHRPPTYLIHENSGRT